MNSVIPNDMNSDQQEASPGYPLSPQQQAHWTRDRQAQHYVARLNLPGRLQRERLLDAFNAVAQRYEILRTTVHASAQGGEPVQRVSAHVPLAVLPQSLPEPAQGLPFAIALHETEEGCVLELSVSAWSADPWSVATLLERLSDRYLDVALPETSLVLQYADLSEGYHALLLDPVGTDYWAARQANLSAEVSAMGARQAVERIALSCPSVVSEGWLFARWVLFLSHWARRSQVVSDYFAAGARFAEDADLVGPIGRLLRLPFNVDWSIDAQQAAAVITKQVESDIACTDHFDCSLKHAHRESPFLFIPACPLPQHFAGMLVNTAELKTPPSHALLQLEVTQPGQLLLTGRGLSATQLAAAAADLGQLLQAGAMPAGIRLGSYPWQAPASATLASGHDVGIAVERWALEHPDRPALLAQDTPLSYAQLNQAVRAAAASLRAHDVRPGHTVALQLRRGIPWIVWWLAVWRVGGTVLPLSGDAPSSRVSDGCRRAGVQLLVCTDLPSDGTADWPAVLVPSTLPVSALQDDQHSAHQPDPAEVAYILFTSGSTGVPKASAVSHGALAAYLNWASARYASDKHGGTLVHSELGFDFTQTCLWLPLLAGETIRFAPDPCSLETLYSLLATETPLSFIKLTPAHLQGIKALESLTPQPLQWPDHVVVGGAALSGAMLPPSLRRSASIVHNEYGPTEATVGCCVHSEPADALVQGPVSIGSATPGTELFVLDAKLQPVTPGTEGELYIAGQQLAQGYLGNPRETAQRFLPHPHAHSPGTRLYRTGDRVRQTDSAHHVYLGRLDDMIKRNGVRIEPGEISAQMLRHPAVSGCHTFARPMAEQAEPTIVCAVTISAAVQVRDLHAWLATQLSVLMLPNRIVIIDHLPCTPQGKIDERWLLTHLEEADRPTTDELAQGHESVLAVIWSQVLGTPELGPSSHFFAEGGDSIRAITVAVEARKQGLMLSVEHLFEYPVLRDLAAAIAPLEQPPASSGSTSTASNPPSAAGIEESFPISHLQIGMIFQNEVDGRYHDIFSYRLGLQLDEACLQQAARQLVARHPGLRTTFDVTHEGGGVQHVWSQGVNVLECQDLSALSPEEQQLRIQQWILQQREIGFDVRSLPLLRMQAYRLDEQTIQFSVSFHHAIMDGWSDQQIHTELFADYRALVERRPVALAPPASRYRDFVAAEQAALRSTETRAYWRNYLADAPHTPLAPQGAAPQESNGSQSHWHHCVTLPARLLHTPLHEATRQSREPLAVLLLSAHLVALRLLTGQREILSCHVTNVRLDEEDAERAVGLYINTLPVRATVANETWRTLVQRIGQQQREAFSHRRLPFSEIQREAGVERLSDSLFYFTNFHNRIAATPALVQHDRFAHEVTSFPLTASFNVEPTTGQISYTLAFDTRHFSQARAKQAAQCYQGALNSLANSIDAPLPTLLELTQLRPSVLIGDTPVESRPCNVLSLFDEQVRLNPEAQAIRSSDGLLNYRQLAARSCALASALSSRGIGPGSVVGLLLPRGADLAVAILSVLRTGACFVVLDAQDPPPRFAHILRDTSFVMDHQDNAHRVPSHPWESLQVLEDEARSVPAGLELAIDPGLPAYRMYTSGSTGTPKCVEVTHSNYTNVLLHFRALLGTRPGDRVMLTSALSFDISLLEFGLPLVSGAMLQVLTREQALTPSAYQMTEHTTGKTVIQATPSLWGALRLRGWQRTPQTQVLVGGEPLPTQLGEWLCQVADEAWNVYGPTETTIWSTVARLEPNKQTIGAPITATTCFVLDDQLDPVPQGSIGTLYIGGAGVSLGYVGEPVMTATAFLPDAAGGRLYCTGDSALLDETGALVFLGRGDRQVKIAGHRLELEEVEARLRAHPGIAEAAVVHQADSDDRLVAYLVSCGTEPEVTQIELRDWMYSHLPAYALPRAYLWLNELPRSRNGKLDRAALPAAPGGRPSLSARYVAPEQALEQVLQRIWCKVLKVEPIGVNDSFIELGGYSLTAIRIIAQIRDLFDVQLDASALFKATTIRQLASQLLNSAPTSAQLETKAELLLSIL